MTELERVGLWNTTAGKPCGASNGEDELMRSQVLFIAEEITGTSELYESFRRGKEHGLLDGCGDVLVTAAGVLHLIGHDSFKRLPAENDTGDKDIMEVVDELYFLGLSLKEDPLRLDPASVANACIQYVCDILHIKGYDPEAVLKIVNDSNFSKFCNSAEEAKASVRAYMGKKRYKKVNYKKVGAYRIVFGDDVVNNTKAKTLKSIHFKEPCFLDMIKEVNPELMEEI
jgi:hypothetical protein